MYSQFARPLLTQSPIIVVSPVPQPGTIAASPGDDMLCVDMNSANPPGLPL
jgi:hypothetical protein